MSMIGKTLGHYQITSQIGKGGMGEVYQAKDQVLGRDVAIKVLPAEFAKDADRVARFQREAKLLASLNHTNIAAIHGLEESGKTNFLVLELVEGETLADQIKKGPIAVEEALKLALQIAEALEAAHEKGVIHRDLKPANIKVTPDGKVKVLDFGLAKAFTGEQENLNLSNSPTLSNAATQQGVILGTAAYMSPEQARGKSVDKRADIWAFGVVLFEMLAGRQLFTGETVSDMLAAVLTREPEWEKTPARIVPLLRRCLSKDPNKRCRDIGDVKLEIEGIQADPSGVLVQPLTAAEARTKLQTMLPWIAAAIFLTAIIAGVAVWQLKPREPRQVVRLDYELPEGQQLNQSVFGNFNLAVSPDGSQFVYGTTEGLYVRSMNVRDARLIAGTDQDSVHPFFSPDGRWLGFWSQSDRKLKKIAINGGEPVVLCDISGLFTGGNWNLDDTIIYSILFNGILRISATGGTPEYIVKGSEGFSNPQILPDGKTLLFTNIFEHKGLAYQIEIQSLESGKREVLHKDSPTMRYLPTGHLLEYNVLNHRVGIIQFNLEKLKAEGGAVPILEGVGGIAISDSGTLAYVLQPRIAVDSKGATSSGCTLVWVSRQGKEEPLPVPPDQYGAFKISPDGKQVALTVGAEGKEDIWIWDNVREIRTRLTIDEGRETTPLWSPDGKRIFFYSDRDVAVLGGIYWKAANHTGEVVKLSVPTGQATAPFSWSKDGNTLVLRELSLFQSDIGMLSMQGDHARRPLLQQWFNENYPQISPDGRWMAYQSDESGKFEVYVRSFPGVESEGRTQISTNGGDSPIWSPDGKELFYRNGDSFMGVAVETAPTFKPGKPKVLFKGSYFSVNSPTGGYALWDIGPDGRFLMVKPPETAASAGVGPRKISIVLNWFEELKQRVPIK